MLDGRFDQQFAEVFAGKFSDPIPPRAHNASVVWLSPLIFIAFALALAGLALS